MERTDLFIKLKHIEAFSGRQCQTFILGAFQNLNHVEPTILVFLTHSCSSSILFHGFSFSPKMISGMFFTCHFLHLSPLCNALNFKLTLMCFSLFL